MRQRIIVGIGATALVAALSVVGVRAVQLRNPAVVQHLNPDARQLTTESMMKIVPAAAEGPGGSFFIGTGDGGNGSYTK
jgi:hypothetical protein